MIIARLKRHGMSMNGSCRIAGYDPSGGWFPASSFNFGFNAKDEESSAPAAPSNNGAGRTAASRPGGQQGTAADSKNKAFSSMTLSKEVDATTCNLMLLAMEERKTKKGVKDKDNLVADIHLLSSVQVPGTQTRSIYTSLMIHLEGVVVEQWSISGSGDERPTENIELKYDKAAMVYRRTPNGKTFDPIEIRGWDQTNNKEWLEYKFAEFLRS